MSDKEKMERLEVMNKGDAANVITRLRHGAQARYKKKTKALLKEWQRVEKELNRRAQEIVKVGPLLS